METASSNTMALYVLGALDSNFPYVSLKCLLEVIKQAEETRSNEGKGTLINDALITKLAEIGNTFSTNRLSQISEIWQMLSPLFQKDPEWTRKYLNDFDSRM